MGQRATLVVITAGRIELYYSHWRANTLDADLFWGPEHATAFARAQRSEAEGADWLDDVWAEGGAIIDHAKQVVLWFGGEDVLYDVPLRRTLLVLMRKRWAPWQVHWAHEGIVDLAEYAGLERSAVLSDTTKEPPQSAVLTAPENLTWTDFVLSVVSARATRFFPLAGNPEDFLASGALLTDAISSARGLTEVDLSAWGAGFPLGGLHLDLDAGTGGVWLARDQPRIRECIAAAPSGIRVCWWREQFEEQLRCTAPYLVFPHTPESKRIEAIRQILLREDRDMGQNFVRLIEQTAKQKNASQVEVNAFALRDNPILLTRETRSAILDGLLADIVAT